MNYLSFRKKKKIKLTSEEMLIEYYFIGENIKYEKQKKIDFLKNDEKNFRIVDFYLPKLNIYVEYYGMYNSTKVIREDYDKKTKVYIKNNLPTVFIYPHELGFLDYSFNNKVLKVLRLKKFKKRSYLIKYKLNRFYKKGNLKTLLNTLFFLYLMVVFYTIDTGLTEPMNALMSLVFGISFVFYFGKFLDNLINYFYYDA